MKKNNSNKSFGIVFFLVFLLIAFFPLIDGGAIRVWSLVISIIFLILGLINSKLLTPLNLAWIKFGELLGKVIAPIVMGIIYFFVITPIGLFMRILGKDLLNTKLSSNRSYWIKREKNIGSMKRQF